MTDIDPRVLAWVNSEREARDIGPPLDELPKGDRGNIYQCVIARALDAIVDGQEVVYEFRDADVVDLPEYVAQFIKEFDAEHFPELIEAE